MYNINRRKFLGLFGCSCCSIILPSCSTVPITERKQLNIIPESRINRQAVAAYENFRNKAKIINEGITNIKFSDLLINSSLIAGSNKYATAEVLPSKRTEKKTDINILLKYFFV